LNLSLSSTVSPEKNMTSPSTWLSNIASRLSFGAMLLLPLMAMGEEFVGPPAPSSPPDEMNAFDKPRDYISGEFVGFVRSVDRFFGNDRNYQEANDSMLQIDIIRVMGYGGEHKFAWSARANVRLPIAEQKLHLLLETDPDKNATVDPKLSLSPPLKQPSTPQSYAAALRFEKKEAERWHFSADGGIKFQGLNSYPFARTRASLALPKGLWQRRLSETVFWFNSTGVGATTQLDLERPISEPVLFRATSVSTWLNDSQNFYLRQDMAVIHKLDDRTAMLYQASAVGVTRPQTQVTDYVILMLYRYRLHRDWVFLEISPQLHFPRERDFRFSSLLSMRLEMRFDESN
jgi:hypothetical protein